MKLFKNNQYGRSMVEMLGVLAIIGVLSVGGIAGYSKAMYKQKMNKTVDIVSKVLMGINEWSSKNIDDNFDNQNAIKLGILDKSLCNNSNECILPTGGRINVYDDGIEIQFRESNRINLCIDFLSHHWENSSGIFDVITATTYNGEHHYIYSTNTNLGIKTNYTLADIEEACNTACDNEWVCYVYFYNWNKSDYVL